MTCHVDRTRAGILALAALLTVSSPASARRHASAPGFKYVGGTEDVGWNCEGRLQLSGETLTFRCGETTLAIPYASISLMQYRPDVSAKIREMSLNWKVRPPHGRGKKNRYFSVIYSRDGKIHAVILEAQPDVMRPYLAEIDLKSGKRVEVRGYENYE